MRHFKFALALVFSLLSANVSAAVQALPLPMDQAFRLTVSRNGDGGLSLTWAIEKGYYLYRDQLAAKAAGSAVPLETPAGTLKDDPGFGRTEVYYDSVIATANIDAPTLTLTYQGCQEDGLCYPPTTRTIDTRTLAVEGGALPGGFSLPAQSSWQQGKIDEPDAAISSPEAPGFVVAPDAASGMVGSLVERGGISLLVAAFLGLGILLAFTPCVFPMYPIVIAMLTRTGGQTTARRGFALSTVYVLALAATFSLLGIVAAWSGQNLQSPLAIGALATLFLALGLSSFGLFNLELPAALTNRFGGRSGSTRTSIGSAAALGFTSAFIIGPCVTAPLAGALLYVAQSGDLLIGASALFALGLGKGIPLILIGTFGVGVLPRAGAWMEQMRIVFGFLFLATALWVADPLLPPSASLALWSALLVTTGVFVGAFDSLGPETGSARRLAKSAGLLMAIYGAVLGVGVAGGATDPLRPLAVFGGKAEAQAATGKSKADFAKITSVADLEASLQDASGNRPTLVYVTADWCVTCRQIERRVLPDAAVGSGLDRLQLLQVDLTQMDAENGALMRALSVAGPPTLIFFDAQKSEVAGTRLVGEVTIDNLVASAATARAAIR